jgi:hypothetical protein
MQTYSSKCVAVRNLDISGNVTTMRPCAPALSLVELGKKLLLSAKEGDTEQVRLLMSKGAPFTTDWVSPQFAMSFIKLVKMKYYGERQLIQHLAEVWHI